MRSISFQNFYIQYSKRINIKDSYFLSEMISFRCNCYTWYYVVKEEIRGIFIEYLRSKYKRLQQKNTDFSLNIIVCHNHITVLFENFFR